MNALNRWTGGKKEAAFRIIRKGVTKGLARGMVVHNKKCQPPFYFQL